MTGGDGWIRSLYVQLTEHIHGRYESGELDDDEAAGELVRVGCPPEMARQMVAEWKENACDD